MQTFLPYPNFISSAKVLDKKRCWKQVIEAKQIIDVLELKEKLNSTIVEVRVLGTVKIGWQNHPAVKMWEGNLPALKRYFNEFLVVCKSTHKINTQYNNYPKKELGWDNPWWLGNFNFHRAMRARLIEKNPEFYESLFLNDKGFNDSKYLWPDMETKTLKII